MKGGLERDEWGHPAVISLLFLLLLDLHFLFSLPTFSVALLSFSFNQGNQSDINLHFPTAARYQ